jgi:DnaJ-class molecular chaperone
MGNLTVNVKIESDKKFRLENGNIIEDVEIDLATVLFNDKGDYIVDSVLGKKYRIDIKNPKNLSTLKFTVKGNGIINAQGRIGDYIANLVVIAPDLEKIDKKDLDTLKDILSK